MVLDTDKAKQDEILVKKGMKKVSKYARDVEFNMSRRTTARDFLWHLRRIHHWWNCTGADNKSPPLEVVLTK